MQMRSWGFWGTVLTVLFGIWGVYAVVFYEKRPELAVTTVSNTRIFEIKEKVADLDVLYHDKSIAQQGQMLSVVVVQFANLGDAPILKSYYDSAFPVGLIIKDGILIQPPSLIDMSDPYFAKALRMRLQGDDTLFVSDLIIDAGSYFTIKLLVLHDEALSPRVEPTGKIAGLEKIVAHVAGSAEHTATVRSPRPWKDRLRDTILGTGLFLLFIISATVVLSILYGLFTWTTPWFITSYRDWLRVRTFLRTREGWSRRERTIVSSLILGWGLKRLTELIEVASGCMGPTTYRGFKRKRRILEHLIEKGVIYEDREGSLHPNPARVGYLRELADYLESESPTGASARVDSRGTAPPGERPD